MRRLILVLCLLAVSLPLYPAGSAHAQSVNCSQAYETIRGYIPVAQGTPDATELHYQVELPNPAVAGSGPYASVLDYSGYEPGIYIYDGLDDHFLCQGYAVIGLNIRGTGCSGGKFDYFEPRQAEDGREAIEWLTKQDWSNGRLAMVGKSYPGITQLFVGGQPGPDGQPPQTPKGLVAMVPGHVFGDLYRDVPYPGGIMNVTFAAGWSAGRIYEPFTAPMEHYQDTGDQECVRNMAEHVQNPPFNPFVRAASNQYDGDLFHERSPWYWVKNIDVPTMLVEAWQDEEVGSRATELTERFDPDLTWRAIFTNGSHGEYYGHDVLPYIDEFLRFYLAQEIPSRFQGGTVSTFVPKHDNAGSVRSGKGSYVTRPETYDEALSRYEAEPKVQINWENRDDSAAWISRYGDWPIPSTKVYRLNLTADGKLTEGDAAPGTVDYRYQPGSSQQRGGYKLTDKIPDVPDNVPATWEERPAEGTSAMFETAPLDSDKVFAGPGSLDLKLSSTAPDTDLQVTLTEVRPDGQEMFVQQGWLRASHRKEDPELSTPLRPFQTHVATDVQPLVPSQPSSMRVEIFPFGHVFRAGSRIRIYVEAPHVKPDLWGFAILPTPAVNTIYTGPGASSLALPLLDGEAPRAPLPACPLDNQPCRTAN
ncbi:MAG TPA: CocE/NonD family hydrolase [Actinomycetota bacterium]|nr:CocE/NonD family hydrolase [Actinomycetota bacterium]